VEQNKNSTARPQTKVTAKEKRKTWIAEETWKKNGENNSLSRAYTRKRIQSNITPLQKRQKQVPK